MSEEMVVRQCAPTLAGIKAGSLFPCPCTDRDALLDEVRQLLTGGLPRDATALQAIGFKQFLAVAEGRATTAEAIEEVKLRSRQYAKRQLTWFRRNPDVHWLRMTGTEDFSEVLSAARQNIPFSAL